MSNNYRMSYFMPPIAPIKDKQGRLTTPPTLIPFCEVSIEQVFQMITCNENRKTLTAQVPVSYTHLDVYKRQQSPHPRHP